MTPETVDTASKARAGFYVVGLMDILGQGATLGALPPLPSTEKACKQSVEKTNECIARIKMFRKSFSDLFRGIAPLESDKEAIHWSYSSPIALGDSGVKFSVRQIDRQASNGDALFVVVGDAIYAPVAFIGDPADAYALGYSAVHPSFGTLNGESIAPLAEAWYKVYSHPSNVGKVTHAYWDIGYVLYRPLTAAIPALKDTPKGQFGLETFQPPKQ
jgi:hypothetical protein